MTAALHGRFLPVSLDLIRWRQILTNNTNAFFLFRKSAIYVLKKFNYEDVDEEALFYANWGNSEYKLWRGFSCSRQLKRRKMNILSQYKSKSHITRLCMVHLLSVFYHKYTFSCPHSQAWPAEQVEQLFHPSSINHNFKCVNISEQRLTEHMAFFFLHFTWYSFKCQQSSMVSVGVHATLRMFV